MIKGDMDEKHTIARARSSDPDATGRLTQPNAASCAQTTTGGAASLCDEEVMDTTSATRPKRGPQKKSSSDKGNSNRHPAPPTTSARRAAVSAKETQRKIAKRNIFNDRDQFHELQEEIRGSELVAVTNYGNQHAVADAIERRVADMEERTRRKNSAMVSKADDGDGKKRTHHGFRFRRHGNVPNSVLDDMGDAMDKSSKKTLSEAGLLSLEQMKDECCRTSERVFIKRHYDPPMDASSGPVDARLKNLRASARPEHELVFRRSDYLESPCNRAKKCFKVKADPLLLDAVPLLSSLEQEMEPNQPGGPAFRSSWAPGSSDGGSDSGSNRRNFLNRASDSFRDAMGSSSRKLSIAGLSSLQDELDHGHSGGADSSSNNPCVKRGLDTSCVPRPSPPPSVVLVSLGEKIEQERLATLDAARNSPLSVARPA